MTFGPPGVSSTFEGLRSRCTIPAAWIAVSASASPVARPYSICGSTGPRESTYSASEGPSAYSVTRNGRAEVVSASRTRTVHTPRTRVSAVTSRLNRVRNSASSAISGRSTFSATGRPSWPEARYTTPIPPAPSRASSWYEPTRVGSVSRRGVRANPIPPSARRQSSRIGTTRRDPLGAVSSGLTVRGSCQQQVPVVIGVGLVGDGEPGGGQPAAHLAAGRVVVVAAAVGGRRQRPAGELHGDVRGGLVVEHGGQAGRDDGPVLGGYVLQRVDAQEA